MSYAHAHIAKVDGRHGVLRGVLGASAGALRIVAASTSLLFSCKVGQDGIVAESLESMHFTQFIS